MKTYSTTTQPGRGEGSKLGYPTLNLAIPPNFSPKEGIYAGYIWLKGVKHPTAFHYGPVPIFRQTSLSLEAHIIGQTINSADHSEIKFRLVKYLRPIKNFSTPEKLSKQIKKDCQQALGVLEWNGC